MAEKELTPGAEYVAEDDVFGGGAESEFGD
jgi:hypothetical protein